MKLSLGIRSLSSIAVGIALNGCAGDVEEPTEDESELVGTEEEDGAAVAQTQDALSKKMKCLYFKTQHMTKGCSSVSVKRYMRAIGCGKYA